jgi:hypothetical protein
VHRPTAQLASAARTGAAADRARAASPLPLLRRRTSRVQGGNPAATDRQEQPGARERRDELAALLQAHPQPVEPGSRTVVQHDREQRVLGRVDQRQRNAVTRHHRVDQPHARCPVDAEQGQHHRGHRKIAGQHQPAPANPVGNDPGNGREQRRGVDADRDEGCRRVAASQGLHPDARDQGHRGVAEQRGGQAGQVEPGIPGVLAIERIRPRRLEHDALNQAPIVRATPHCEVCERSQRSGARCRSQCESLQS